MKIISLNTWGGRAGLKQLLAFFEEHEDIDIFCLQEVWNGGHHMMSPNSTGFVLEEVVTELFQKIGSTLQNHDGYFRPNFFDFYGLGIFVKKSIRIIREGECFVHQERGFVTPGVMAKHARNIQYLTYDTVVGKRTVINFHGLWDGSKADSPDRLLQSDNILKFLRTLDHPCILCGDFNLMPETESLARIERFGLRNLVCEYGVTTTRSDLYKKPEKFADYVFVDQKLTVNDFTVLLCKVSDHLPIYMHIV